MCPRFLNFSGKRKFGPYCYGRDENRAIGIIHLYFPASFFKQHGTHVSREARKNDNTVASAFSSVFHGDDHSSLPIFL